MGYRIFELYNNTYESNSDFTRWVGEWCKEDDGWRNYNGESDYCIKVIYLKTKIVEGNGKGKKRASYFSGRLFGS